MATGIVMPAMLEAGTDLVCWSNGRVEVSDVCGHLATLL